MNQVPTTVEEAEEILRETVQRDPIASEAIIGIFRCRMGMGDSFLKAYEAALLHLVKAAENRR